MRIIRKIDTITFVPIFVIIVLLMCVSATYYVSKLPPVKYEPIPIARYPHTQNYKTTDNPTSRHESPLYEWYTITFSTNDSPETIYHFYSAIMPLYRWIEDDSGNIHVYGQRFSQSDTHTASGGHFITIKTAQASDNQTRVTLAYFFQNS
jgi:hypothetical protein